MCVEIGVTKRGAVVWCGNVGDLRKALYPHKVVFDPEYTVETLRPETCLCPVDVPATAKAAGFSTKYDPVWWEWMLEDATQ